MAHFEPFYPQNWIKQKVAGVYCFIKSIWAFLIQSHLFWIYRQKLSGSSDLVNGIQRLHIWPEAGLRATYLSDVSKVAAG